MAVFRTTSGNSSVEFETDANNDVAEIRVVAGRRGVTINIGGRTYTVGVGSSQTITSVLADAVKPFTYRTNRVTIPHWIHW